MLDKINILNNINYNALAQNLGVGVMTLATVIGMLELPSHTVSRTAILPAYSKVVEENFEEMNNPMRREKEEAGPQYVSYEVSQRTPSRSGKY